MRPTTAVKHPKQEITDLLARTIKTEADEERLNIKDKVVQGFTLRVTSKGAKTFAMMMRDSTGRNRTYTIGSYPELSVKVARSMAEKIRHGVRYDGNIEVLRTGKKAPAATTLSELLDEAQINFAKSKKGWRPRGSESSKTNARSTIESVFEQLLERQVETLVERDLAKYANDYKPRRPLKGKDTANGQVSRALSYLGPVFDWAAHRGKYQKIGAGREIALRVPMVSLVYDPATDDPTITGKRERVLFVPELVAILPLLTYPAHPKLRRRNTMPTRDFGPIAIKFLFLTLARIEEISTARWQDFDFINGVWKKPDVKTKGGVVRSQHLPLSRAALNLLTSLPGYEAGDLTAYVFPNRDGGQQENWDRITDAIQAVSGTEDWHRHDIRRTGATLLRELSVSLEIIETILNHSTPLQKAGASESAAHYLIAVRILNNREDPIVAALNKLSEALEVIVAHGGEPVAA